MLNNKTFKKMDLEEYLEMFPQEIRHTLNRIAQIDSSAQNDVHGLEKQMENLFTKCSHLEIGSPEANRSIRGKYCKVLEDADTKVYLAENISDSAKRLARNLDSKLLEMKCKLERNNSGITEILERRVLEMDDSSIDAESCTTDHRSRSKPEKRVMPIPAAARIVGGIRQKKHRGRQSDNPKGTGTGKSSTFVSKSQEKSEEKLTDNSESTGNSSNFGGTEPKSSSKLEKRRDGNLIFGTPSEKRLAVSSYTTTKPVPARRDTTHHPVRPATHHNQSAASFIGAGDAITPVAMQKIAALKQIHGVGLTADVSETDIDADAASPTNIKNTSTSIGCSKRELQAFQNLSLHSSSSLPENGNKIDVDHTSDGEWTYDLTETRYCVCNQISYGDMVGCDNKRCPIEWFHYPCVGITSAPKGKWYCPKCVSRSSNTRKSTNTKKN